MATGTLAADPGVVHALAACHHVVEQRAAGGGRLPFRDPGDDVAMLARRNGKRAALGQRRVAEEMQLVDEAPVHVQQLGIAGELDQPVVEIDVGGEIGVDVALGGSLFHPVDADAELAQVGGRCRLREPAADEFVQHRAQLVDFVGFLDRNPAHEHAAILLQPHEARFLERAERFAHGAARDAETLGDRRFVQLAAGRQAAGKNEALELLLHERGQRARLDERDGIRAVPGGQRPMARRGAAEPSARGAREAARPPLTFVFNILRIGRGLM